jgi:hypothetical protein
MCLKPSSEIILDILAILASLAMTALVATVTTNSAYLTSWGPLDSTRRQIFIAGTTIAATLITGFIVSRLQGLILRRFEFHFLHDDQLNDLQKAGRKWRVILRVNGFVESFHHKRIVLAYAFTGLITTSIVSTMAPTLSTKEFLYDQAIFEGGDSLMDVGDDRTPGICTYVRPREYVESQIDRDYYWDLGDGNAYWIPSNLGGCPTRKAQLLLGLINLYDASQYAYSDGGVAVHRSAIGAPRTLYSPEPRVAPVLAEISSAYGASVLEVSLCAPVMTRNPIRCRPGGTVDLLSNDTFAITSDDGLCSYGLNFTGSRNPRTRQTMIKTMCTHGDVGQGTMAMAASGGYAHWLAVAINDTAHAPSTDVPVDQATYVVSCTVDARRAFEHRRVRLRFASPGSDAAAAAAAAGPGADGSRHSRILAGGGEACDGPPVERALVATVAAANWQTLFQGTGNDGWFDLVWESAGGHPGRSPPWAFADSQNALEDVFGLVGALVGSRFQGSQSYNVTTTVKVSATRVGSRNLFALFYMAPPAFAAMLLAALYLRALPADAQFESTDLVKLKEYFENKAKHASDLPRS